MDLPFCVGISPTLHIRGIIATRDIRKGEVIERCPLIFIPLEEERYLKQTILWKYYYEWTNKLHCVALGYGSLINHSYSPNTAYLYDYRHKTLNFEAIRPIKKGEEIVVNYNGDPESQEALDDILTDGNHHFVSANKTGGIPERQLTLPFRIGESPTLSIRGLIATRKILKNEIIEYCPVVLFPVREEKAMNSYIVANYYFEWDTHFSAFAFGYGALMNHTAKPNIHFVPSPKHLAVVFTALRDILEGEELFVNYNGYDEDKDDEVDEEYVNFDAHQKRFR